MKSNNHFIPCPNCDSQVRPTIKDSLCSFNGLFGFYKCPYCDKEYYQKITLKVILFLIFLPGAGSAVLALTSAYFLNTMWPGLTLAVIASLPIGHFVRIFPFVSVQSLKQKKIAFWGRIIFVVLALFFAIVVLMNTDIDYQKLHALKVILSN